MPKESKDRLLAKALHIFAAQGYQGTSTRELAETAKVNISAITYYFGGKKGLYHAVLEEVVRQAKLFLGTKLAEASELLTSTESTAQEAEEKLYDLLRTLCEIICSDRIPSDVSTIFLHEYGNPSDMFQTLHQGLIAPIYKIFTALVIKATNDKIESDEANLFTIPLFAQVFTLKTRKIIFLEHMGWSDYGPAEIKAITDMLIKQVRAVLNLYKTQEC